MIQIFVLITFVLFGQTKSINFKEIKRIVNNNSYEKLFDRFIANNTTLSLDDYIIIYYGQTYKANYKPTARHDLVRVLNSYLINSKNSIDFYKVLHYTKKILK